MIDRLGTVKDLRVLSVASEVYPLIKTGGLADVVAALPPALAREGIATRTLVPGYPGVIDALRDAETMHTFAHLHGGPARLLAAHVAGLDLLVLDAPHLYARPGNPYLGPDGSDWPDNALRFAALAECAAAIARGAVAGLAPDVVHAHDWQAGLVPALLHYGGTPRPGTVMTVHNLSFQGQFPRELLATIGLPPHAYAIDGVEYHGTIGYLKAGLALADRITTVSPTYAAEIRTPEGGMGLDGLLRARADVLTGILNGIDDDGVESGDRRASRRALRREAPRAARGEQDGAAGALRPRRRARGLRVRRRQPVDAAEGNGPAARCAAGADRQRRAARAPRHRREDRSRTASPRPRPATRAASRAVIGYDEALAHLVQGGVDALLVPSRFEPCGLTQLCALRYGAIPVVARVGGLADTVIDANEMALAAGCRHRHPVRAGDARKPGARDRPRAWRSARDRALWRRHAIARDGNRRRLDPPREAVRRALSRPRRAPRGLIHAPRRSREPRAARRHARRPAAPTSRSSRRTRRRSSSASSTRPARPSGSASSCPSAPATSSTASSPGSLPAIATGCARTARTTCATGTASIRRSSSSIRTRGRSIARSRSTRRCSAAARTARLRDDTDSAPFVPKAIVAAGAVPARREASARAVGEDDRLRAARARIHQDASGRAGSPARHLRRSRPPGGDRPSDAARRHDRRADADRRGDRRAPSRAAGPRPTTGATTPRRCSSPIRGSRRAASTSCAACVAALHAAGIEVLARRRPQPHRRGRRARTDAVAARPRQRDLLPDRCRRSRPVRRRHRLRQHAGARPAAGAAPRDGRASLLRRGGGRRRLSLRPRHDARPPRRRLRSGGAAAAGDRAGSRAARPEADRRAVGRRTRRTPARRVSAGLGRMERPLSRHGAAVLARRRRR